MHAFYINLDHRTDRRAEAEKEFESRDLAVERFPATYCSTGAIGCNLSHIGVLITARARGYESVMIFEDDFQFLVSKEQWNDLIAKLPASYDVVMLSYNLVAGTSHDETFYRVQDVQTTSGYIVHSRFYDTLIARWQEGAGLFMSNPTMDWVYILDQYWKPLQARCEWFAYKVRIGKQRPSFSDIAGRFAERDT
jgi:GR25 family glycosyltransferase involved in LPS biosynthesis